MGCAAVAVPLHLVLHSSLFTLLSRASTGWYVKLSQPQSDGVGRVCMFACIVSSANVSQTVSDMADPAAAGGTAKPHVYYAPAEDYTSAHLQHGSCAQAGFLKRNGLSPLG